MCGISGVITKEPFASTLLSNVRRMNAAQIHRGPDGEGEHHHPHTLLAMRRLSIIDPIGGDQPLYNEDRSVVAIANGEIYNFPDLRSGLERAGHTFRTGSDCETIVHLYEEHGLDCVKHLRGMFAFALWDASRRRLVLARDRMGEKPLYLHEQPGQLLFSSELKSLLHSSLVPFTLDPQSIDHYFHYQFVPEPHTPLRNVRKLEAAHLLTIDVDPWRVEDRCYWRMEDAPPIEANPTIALREQLEDAGRIVTRADRNVGIALSGGLDSSLVAAIAAKSSSLSAFSVGYRSRPHSDERHDAQTFARSLGLNFHEIELDTPTVVDFFPELNYWRDDPIADIAGHGYYAVMRLARERNVPVMLQGQGGDELFWGYPALREAAVASHAKRKGDRMVFYDRLSDYHAAAEMRAHYVPRFAAQVDPKGAGGLFTFARPWPNIDVTMTRLASDTYLRGNGIAQGDRLSMASGVEMRVPLVDHKLIETVIGLRKHRSDLKLAPKTWLRESVRHLLPDYVLQRPKRGFEPPTREWHDAIFAAHGRSLIGGALVSEGILRPESAAYLATGPFPNNATCPLSFKALVLEQWHRQMRSRCAS